MPVTCMPKAISSHKDLGTIERAGKVVVMFGDHKLYVWNRAQTIAKFRRIKHRAIIFSMNIGSQDQSTALYIR